MCYLSLESVLLKVSILIDLRVKTKDLCAVIFFCKKQHLCQRIYTAKGNFTYILNRFNIQITLTPHPRIQTGLLSCLRTILRPISSRTRSNVSAWARRRFCACTCGLTSSGRLLVGVTVANYNNCFFICANYESRLLKRNDRC